VGEKSEAKATAPGKARLKNIKSPWGKHPSIDLNFRGGDERVDQGIRQRSGGRKRKLPRSTTHRSEKKDGDGADATIWANVKGGREVEKKVRFAKSGFTNGVDVE